MKSEAEVALACSRVGEFDLAVGAERVVLVASWEQVVRQERASTLDLAALLGAALPSTDRRALGLSGPTSDLWLGMGPHVRVRRVPLRCLAPLPALLTGAGLRFACTRVLVDEEGLCFVLDAGALVELSRAQHHDSRGGRP
ncbi:MAG: hypothetical protein HY901_28170 [Deltaproteobacteria bacterium]|nr:hypothetical protein [Deltaproteobacteria bacterium]